MGLKAECSIIYPSNRPINIAIRDSFLSLLVAQLVLHNQHCAFSDIVYTDIAIVSSY